MKLKLLPVLLAVGACACNHPSTQNNEQANAGSDTAVITKADSSVSANIDEQETINGTKGVIVENDAANKNDSIKIYNEDGSLWYAFSFNYDEAKGFDRNNDFDPFVFHPRRHLLAMRCIKKDKNRYQVVVNKKTKEMKYVNADDKDLKFQSWPQHILSVFSVSFDADENQVHKTNSEKSDTIAFDNDDSYFPVKIAGDWLQINTGTEKAPVLGWIKWKNNGKLLVQLNYMD